ncbi:tetratricopeptide repeat protein [Flavobacterium faecale]|uniref:tetratricopeptide repeat protein n=1 Tax=Flavobacterium faecale TaxID=1355330 RepID=UPI003AB07724
MKWILFLLFPVLLFSQSNYEKAKSAFDKETTEKLRLKYESILKTDPNNLKALEELGDVAGLNKLWDKALAYYGRLKSLKPNEADYHYKYGGTLGMKALEVNKFKALGMIGDIKDSFEKAIALDSKHIEARWALIELYLKLPALIGGSESKAIVYSNQLLTISQVDGYLSRGHIEEYYNRFKSAEQYYKKAIEVGGSKHSYQLLADLYKNKMGAPDKARTILEEYKGKNSLN